MCAKIRADDHDHEPELDLQRRVAPAVEVRRHRRAGHDQHADRRDQGPDPEPPRRGPERHAVPRARGAPARRPRRASADRRRRRPSRASAATGPRSRTSSAAHRAQTPPPMNFARDVVDAAPPERLALVELDARRRPPRVVASARSSDRSARLAGDAARARRRTRRRRDDADRQPARVGAHDGRVLPDRRRRAAVQRAAARQGPAAAPRRRQPEADRRRRAQRRGARRRPDPACPVLAVPDEALFAPSRPRRSSSRPPTRA